MTGGDALETGRSEPRVAPHNRVCLAIPTFRRPKLLKLLLESLVHQTAFDHAHVEIFVLDNDEARSAEAVVSESPIEARYIPVPQPGLSSVRNIALQIAEDYDFLAMMDDDQIPDRRWLAELLRVQRELSADAVIGPVSYALVGPTEPWLLTHDFFPTTVYAAADGARIRDGNSGNCLISTKAVKSLNLTFESSLNFSGGEDQFFFRSLHARGGYIVFASFAIAQEAVQHERQQVKWILLRQFRRGTSLAFCDVRVSRSIGNLVIRVAKGVARILIGLTMALPLYSIRGKAGMIQAACDVSLGLGMLCGLVGWRARYYKR